MVTECVRDFGEGPRSVCSTMGGKGVVDKNVVQAAVISALASTERRSSLTAVVGEVGKVEGGGELV